MSRTYDINDPTDIAILEAHYDSISQEEWQAYIEFTQQPEYKKQFTFEERGCLMQMAKQAGQYRQWANGRFCNYSLTYSKSALWKIK